MIIETPDELPPVNITVVSNWENGEDVVFVATVGSTQLGVPMSSKEAVALAKELLDAAEVSTQMDTAYMTAVRNGTL